jgi:uncharacterized protein YkwD
MARRFLLLSAAAAALTLPAAPAAAAGCAGADTELSLLSIASARSAVLCLVNEQRTSRGLNALEQDDVLQRAAQAHSVDMVLRGFFDHVNPDGDDPFDRMRAAGYEFSSAGENIAAGYETPADVMRGWMNSPGHCENVLGAGFTELGVGIDLLAATISRGTGTWTQNFGRPLRTPAPDNPEGADEDCAGGTAGDDSVALPVETPGTGDLPGADTPAGGEATPLTTAPARLTLRLRRGARRLTIAGRLAAADGTRVRIVLRRAGRTVFRTRTTLRDGRYRVRIETPADAGRLTVVVKAAGQRATRTSLTR